MRRMILAGMLMGAGAMAHAAPAACPEPAVEARSIFDGYQGCNPIGSYYDELRSAKPDWQGVHRCAVQERNDAVLMMLYANGFGVPRDIDRAIGHACRVDGAVAETRFRIEHLERIRVAREKDPFDLCDDITSGMMGGFCADIAESAREAQRGDALARLDAAFTPVQRTRFAALRKAADAFAQGVGDDETDLSGTARVAMAIGARQKVASRQLARMRVSPPPTET